MRETCDGGWHNILDFGSNKEGCNAKQLEFSEGYDSGREEVVKDVDCEEKGFRHQEEAGVDLDEPVS